MKKVVVLLLLLLLISTGCSAFKLSDNMDDNIDSMLSNKSKLYNVQYSGYKFYLPKGMKFVNKEEYNAILKDSKNNAYYMYVDVISYYHKTDNDYEENKASYYSKELNYNNKRGYIHIDEYKNKYYIQFLYNYVKMETYIPKDDLNDVIINMCTILNSLKFNDTILDSLIGDNVLSYKEEVYSLFKEEIKTEDFLDVVEREETDKYKQDLEDEKIVIED